MAPELGGTGARLARYYDLDLATDPGDLDLYLALAAASEGPILELAAGTGRIALPLAAAGHAVTAVDRDPDMLARAAGSMVGRFIAGRPVGTRGSLELVEADITTLQLPKRYGLVILALSSLLLLPAREAQVAALRTMERHLAPDGRAVIDVWLPAPEDLALYDGRLNVEWVRRDALRRDAPAGDAPAGGADSGDWVAKLVSASYEPATAIGRVETFFDSWPAEGGLVTRVARSDELHFVGMSELRELVQLAGLAVQSVGGDYAMGELEPDSARAVLVCSLL